MTKETSIIIEELIGQTQTNEIIVQYQNHVSFIAREDYYPNEDGVVIFHKKDIRNDEIGYSVAEMLELLLRYRDVVDGISFQTWNGTLQSYMNMYESEAFSGHGDLSTVVMVGNDEDTNFIDKVELNSDYESSILYPELRGITLRNLKNEY